MTSLHGRPSTPDIDCSSLNDDPGRHEVAVAVSQIRGHSDERPRTDRNPAARHRHSAIANVTYKRQMTNEHNITEIVEIAGLRITLGSGSATARPHIGRRRAPY